MLFYENFKTLAAATVALTTLNGAAGAGELTADLRQEVIANCLSDAYRLCPQSLTSVSDAAACMRRKHAELTVVCRTPFDRAARALAQK